MARQTRRTFLKRSLAAGAAWGVAGAAAAQLAAGAEKKFRPKFSMCNETFGDWPFEKAFALVADCGYDGLEIAPFTVSNDVTDVSARQRTRIRRQAEKVGLEIIGLHWLLAKTEGLHLTSPEKETRTRTTDYLGELARFCADLGGKVLVFGSPKQRNLLPGVSREQGMQYAAEVFRAAMPAMEQSGVMLALEPLAPAETSFLDTAAEAVELIELVDSPRCQLLLDCKAMWSESTPIPELIRRHGDRLVHFHANDPNLQGPGFGELDFVPVLQALADVDFSGWVSVEVFDYTPGPERLARESIRYMQECLKKLKA